MFIFNTFKLLRDHHPRKLVLIFFITLLMGVNSGFSILLLIPLLQLLNVGSETVTDGPALVFQNMADKAGIEITIETVLLVYVVILTLSALLQYWKSMLDARYQQTFIYNLRRRLFRKIIMAEWQTLNGRSKTNHLQVLTKEVPNLANYYYFYLRLITTLIITSSYIAYAMLVSAKFTLIIITTGIILFVLLRRFLFRAFHLGEGFVDSYNRLLKYIDDFWQTVKIAKVHNTEDFYYNRFDEASTSLLDLEYRMQRNWSLPQLIQRIAGLIVLVFVVWAGYRSGAVPLASFVILILLFSRIFPQFIALNTDINMIVSNVASVKLVMQLDADLPDAREEKAKVEAEVKVKVRREIRLESISFSYPDGDRLFEGFNAIIKANSITGITGVSGRGKTTLIDLIAGLQRPGSGKMYIDGQELNEELLSSWKSGIGYLPQDSFFIDGTLRENMVWDSGGEISDDEISDVLGQVNALHLVNRFRKGLDAFIVNYHFAFSGGECQRLALARVLLRKPSLLLLDEATSSLDAENEAMIMEVLARLKEKITIVFVTHRESVTRWFDTVIKL
ncbi:MAG: ABC transporter ATP-binding protein/permease [Bacteroidales bacterium]|nr:ABC transporter ATP-binding protein/permease [Bacteroidales bacterium]